MEDGAPPAPLCSSILPVVPKAPDPSGRIEDGEERKTVTASASELWRAWNSVNPNLRSPTTTLISRCTPSLISNPFPIKTTITIIEMQNNNDTITSDDPTRDRSTDLKLRVVDGQRSWIKRLIPKDYCMKCGCQHAERKRRDDRESSSQVRGDAVNKAGYIESENQIS